MRTKETYIKVLYTLAALFMLLSGLSGLAFGKEAAEPFVYVSLSFIAIAVTCIIWES